MADAARTSARVLKLPNYGRPPVFQVKRKGRLPSAVTKLSAYSFEKRMSELDKATEEKELAEIKINESIIAMYRERLQRSTFELAHDERLSIKRLIGIHTEWIEKSETKIRQAD
jgi:hypothetical protein